ncbi:MAG: hypothetical protein K5898_08640 [Ruminococcus sp.]|uniref:hypothetical protein n=1 Tax=Ruminococcus sp. TaxID=41978 RepID=UPI0025D03895|nr:hypothetical protein [Ruminococcus sp.]MCR4795216.1 hypothetical protein [Ruminococcus sp.]
MNKFNKFAAAAVAFALAAASTSCGAPEAITFGKSSQTALTVDGYDVPAGVFIFNEIYAYNSARYELYSKNGQMPSMDDVENATFESKGALEWIQDKATEACREFVANEKEFEKIGGELSPEDLAEVKDVLAANISDTSYSANGVGEASLRKVIENSYKSDVVFKHYYGIDAEKGCSEDELKKYYQDKTTRVKYFTISLVDENGEQYGPDEKRILNKMADEYVNDINSQTSNEKKLKKIEECEEKYKEYVDKRAAEAAEKAAKEAGETVTTTTTTTTTAPSGTTTTTTVDPFAKEVLVTKYTTTVAEENDDATATTTTLSAEQEAAKKSQQDYNDYLFNKLSDYKAEKYKYDDDTIYVVIKADIKERMTEDDLWSKNAIDSLLSERYYKDFQDMMKGIAEGLSVKRNNTAYSRYSPFKLELKSE